MSRIQPGICELEQAKRAEDELGDNNQLREDRRGSLIPENNCDEKEHGSQYRTRTYPRLLLLWLKNTANSHYIRFPS